VGVGAAEHEQAHMAAAALRGHGRRVHRLLQDPQQGTASVRTAVCVRAEGGEGPERECRIKCSCTMEGHSSAQIIRQMSCAFLCLFKGRMAICTLTMNVLDAPPSPPLRWGCEARG